MQEMVQSVNSNEADEEGVLIRSSGERKETLDSTKNERTRDSAFSEVISVDDALLQHRARYRGSCCCESSAEIWSFPVRYVWLCTDALQEHLVKRESIVILPTEGTRRVYN